MSVELIVRNGQRRQKIDLSYFRHLLRHLLKKEFQVREGALGVTIVASARMTELNEQFLAHQGSTDVISFDYSEGALAADHIHGELFICVDEAWIQSARYKTSWQGELLRYVVHGILHLRGYNDQTSRQRSIMKKEEDRIVQALQRQWNFEGLSP